MKEVLDNTIVWRNVPKKRCFVWFCGLVRMKTSCEVEVLPLKYELALVNNPLKL